MKLSDLLTSRPTILRQATLAHTATAWSTLQRLATRITAACLRGEVHISRGAPQGEAPWPSLSSSTVRASVLEEHFADEDIFALADALAYATDTEDLELTFALETLGIDYATPLLETLGKSGVILDLDTLDADPDLR